MFGTRYAIFILLGFLVTASIGCVQQPSEKMNAETEQTGQKSAQVVEKTSKTNDKNKTSELSGQIKETGKLTLVELGSVKCIPCKKMKPILDDIKEKYSEQIDVVFHDVWTEEGGRDAEKYKIRLIPTQVFLDKAGKEYFRHEGFYPREEIIKKLKEGGLAE